MKHRFFGLAALLMLSGCAKVVTSQPKPFPQWPIAEAISFEAPHGVVDNPDHEKYWITNNLTYIMTYDPATQDDHGVVVSITHVTFEGLIDSDVEKRLNAKVEAKLQDLKKYAIFENLPVYPGFYAAYPTNWRTIKSLTISAYPYFNANNILSVRFNVSVMINSDVSNTGRAAVELIDALNFDLNTADEITLSDLFVNDSDYQGSLNKLILLKAQSQTDPVPDNLRWWVDAYRYTGGFTGIRGDVKFYLENDKLTLLFNEKYPEFECDFSTVALTLPYEDLKDILAFGQRFVHNDSSLFISKNSEEIRNYLYRAHTEVLIETINGMNVRSEIYVDDELSDLYKNIRDDLLNQNRKTIQSLKDPNIKEVYYQFSSTIYGPYLTVSSSIYFNSNSTGLRRVYQSDGTQLKLSDVFKDGFDYRTYIKGLIDKIIKDSGYQETYDLDQVYESLVPSLSLYSVQETYALTLTNEFIRDFSQDEGDFSIAINITQNQDILKIKPW